MSYFVPQPRFKARFPWLGSDLQTLRASLPGQHVSLASWPGERLFIGLADGDQMLASFHRPTPGDAAATRPLVVLLHGLAGSEDSRYLRATAAFLLHHGWPVLRLNLRGAGPSNPLCRSLYHSGRSEDLREALGVLNHERPALLADGLCLIGFSLGGNLLLKALAEADLPLVPIAAAAVSSPVDLKRTAQRLAAWRNWPYQGRLLAGMRRELHGKLPQGLAQAAAAARSVYALDERVTAPWHGFGSADDYYAQASAGPRLGQIGQPTLLLHADDDPWVPRQAYDCLQWWKPGHPVQLVMARSGGHLGFHGRGSSLAWFNRQILRFFERQLAG